MALLQRGQLGGGVCVRSDKRASLVRNAPFQAAKAPLRGVSRPLRVVCQAATEAAPVYKGDLLNKTYYPTSEDSSNVTKQWYIIDATGQTLGRLACLAANYIRGKTSAAYSPSMDMGSYIIVINSEKVRVTGNKFNDKTYFRHVNGRPGSYTMEKFKDLQKRLPERIIEHAVKGMLPKGRLGRDIRIHLKAFRGSAHPHAAQQPKDITALVNVKPKELPGAKVLAAKRAELATAK